MVNFIWKKWSILLELMLVVQSKFQCWFPLVPDVCNLQSNMLHASRNPFPLPIIHTLDGSMRLEKISRTKAYSQWIVTARPLCHLQHLVRLRSYTGDFAPGYRSFSITKAVRQVLSQSSTGIEHRCRSDKRLRIGGPKTAHPMHDTTSSPGTIGSSLPL